MYASPVENFFCTVEAKFCSEETKDSFPKMINFILDRYKDIKKVKFVNYYFSCLLSMAADLLSFN